MLFITNLINLSELHINDLIVMKDNFTLLLNKRGQPLFISSCPSKSANLTSAEWA